MPAPNGRARVLILGGTAEARVLAGLLAERHSGVLDIVTSLAGRTASPLTPAGRVRRGGSGGAAGLARYLRRAKIDLLVDATHPFAAAISRNAQDAAARAGPAPSPSSVPDALGPAGGGRDPRGQAGAVGLAGAQPRG